MTIGINLLLALFLFLGCLHTIVRISLYRFYVILTIRVIKYGDVECRGWFLGGGGVIISLVFLGL
jgi:hypothetical protein